MTFYVKEKLKKNSNDAYTTPKIIESKKKTIALLLNVQFYQFHHSCIAHEVKFHHNL